MSLREGWGIRAYLSGEGISHSDSRGLPRVSTRPHTALSLVAWPEGCVGLASKRGHAFHRVQTRRWSFFLRVLAHCCCTLTESRKALLCLHSILRLAMVSEGREGLICSFRFVSDESLSHHILDFLWTHVLLFCFLVISVIVWWPSWSSWVTFPTTLSSKYDGRCKGNGHAIYI